MPKKGTALFDRDRMRGFHFDDGGDPCWQRKRSTIDSLFHVKWAFAAVGFVIGLLTGVGIH